MRKENRKADAFLESPRSSTNLLQEGGKKKPRNRRKPFTTEPHRQKYDFLSLFVISDKCLIYLWIPEEPSMCAALTNYEMYEALLSPPTVFPTICWTQLFAADWQPVHSLAQLYCMCAGLFYWLCLSVLEYTIIVFCCLFSDKTDMHVCISLN